ncbi:MAG: hypothetical protein AAGF10_08035, partial [Verrucomicrobiota bacterium]
DSQAAHAAQSDACDEAARLVLLSHELGWLNLPGLEEVAAWIEGDPRWRNVPSDVDVEAYKQGISLQPENRLPPGVPAISMAWEETVWNVLPVAFPELGYASRSGDVLRTTKGEAAFHTARYLRANKLQHYATAARMLADVIEARSAPNKADTSLSDLPFEIEETDPNAEPERTIAAGQATPREQDILLAINELKGGNSRATVDIAAHSGHPRRQVTDSLRAMANRGWVKQDGDRQPYRLTPLGARLVQLIGAL